MKLFNYYITRQLMSPQFKSDAAFGMSMFSKVFLMLLAGLVSYTFWEMKKDISEIKSDVKANSVQMSTDVNGLNNRLIRVEVKLENVLEDKDTAK